MTGLEAGLLISNKKFSNTPVADIPVDTEYTGCNFARQAPDSLGPPVVGVRLFPGDDTPRTFVRCNLVNCEPPPGSTLIRCNTTIREAGVAIETDDVVVDGVTVSTTQKTATFVYGRYNPDTGEYDYEVPPLQIEDQV